jgi:hypothetical protein
VLASSGVIGKDWGEIVEEYLIDYDKQHAIHVARSAARLGTSGGGTRQQCNRMVREYDELLDEQAKAKRKLSNDPIQRMQDSKGVRLITLPSEAALSNDEEKQGAMTSTPVRGAYLRGKWIVTHISEPLKAVGREVHVRLHVFNRSCCSYISF